MRRSASRSLVAVVASIGIAGCATSTSVAPTSPSVAPTSAPASAAVPPTSAAPSPSRGLAKWPAPLFFPSTGRILFTIEGEGESQPVYIDSSGLHVIPVAVDSTIAHPIWAPGDTIIFDSERDGRRHLYRMGIDGRDVVELTPGATWQDSPAISPDGSTIAFGQFIPEPGQDLGIHIAKADGTSSRALTPPSAVGSKEGVDEPTFSPDGTWIAFERIADPDLDRSGLFVIHPDGTGLRRLADDSMGVARPRWSPDGKRIVFNGHSFASSFSPGPLWVVDVAGGAPRPLTDPTDPGVSFEGDWSPDGTQVVFHYFAPDPGSIELHVVDADGTHPRTLWVAPPNHSAETPDWGS